MATLEEILGPTLAGQARLKPPPDDLRGLILASKNLWVPASVENVEEWLVANWKPPVAASAFLPTPPSTLASRPLEPRIEVECTEEGTEEGTCRFSRSYRATGAVSIPVSQLDSLIRDAGSRDQAIEDFEEWANDSHSVDDYDYDGEETSSHETHDSERDGRRSNARSVIEAYLDEHPELLEEEEEEAGPAAGISLLPASPPAAQASEEEIQVGLAQSLLTQEPPPVAEDTNPMPF